MSKTSKKGRENFNDQAINVKEHHDDSNGSSIDQG